MERREEVKGRDWRKKRKGICGQGKMKKERGKEEMDAIQSKRKRIGDGSGVWDSRRMGGGGMRGREGKEGREGGKEERRAREGRGGKREAGMW